MTFTQDSFCPCWEWVEWGTLVVGEWMGFWCVFEQSTDYTSAFILRKCIKLYSWICTYPCIYVTLPKYLHLKNWLLYNDSIVICHDIRKNKPVVSQILMVLFHPDRLALPCAKLFSAFSLKIWPAFRKARSPI